MNEESPVPFSASNDSFESVVFLVLIFVLFVCFLYIYFALENRIDMYLYILLYSLILELFVIYTLTPWYSLSRLLFYDF